MGTIITNLRDVNGESGQTVPDDQRDIGSMDGERESTRKELKLWFAMACAARQTRNECANVIAVHVYLHLHLRLRLRLCLHPQPPGPGRTL